MHDMLQLTTYMFIDTSTLIQINITTQPVFALCFAQNIIIIMLEEVLLPGNQETCNQGAGRAILWDSGTACQPSRPMSM